MRTRSSSRARRNGSWACALLALLAACRAESPAPVTRLDPPGAAGELERVPVMVEPPPENVLATNVCTLLPRWKLNGADRPGVEALFASARVAPEVRARLLAATTCDPSGCLVQPSAADVAAFPKPVRQALYDALYARPADARLIRAYRRAASDAALWADPGLTPAAREAIDFLSITRGSEVFLPDPAALCALVAAPAEQMRAFQVLHRQRALMLRLWVEPNADVDALARYWGRGGREAEVRTLLHSLVATGERRSVDVDYLLPPMPRARLLTFPPASGPNLDCHWTTLHFFDSAPVEQVAEWAVTYENYRANYDEIPATEAAFGDAVVFVLHLADGEHFVHSAVYVANGVVFTKNGVSAARPWLFTTLDDLVARYGVEASDVRWLRRRGL